MNVVDSSCWLEYFADGGNADAFAPIIVDIDALLVPTVTLYEVFKKVFQQRDETQALRAIAIMQQGIVVELSDTLAIRAARISVEHNLPMADSIILATARQNNAVLWTQDEDFEGLEGVEFIRK
jgi:predicted nucleic acid-binding protein